MDSGRSVGGGTVCRRLSQLSSGGDSGRSVGQAQSVSEHAQLEQKSSFAETGKSVSLQHDSCLSRALVSSRALAVPAELERLGWLLPDSPRRRVAARRVAARRRSSRRRSSRARSTLYARRTGSSRPSMVLNFRASSIRSTLYDDDVNCDVQVHKPSRTVVPKRSVMISSNGPLRKRIFRRDP